MRKTHAAAIPKRDTEAAIRTLRNMKLIDNTLELAKKDGTILIPLLFKPPDEDIRELKTRFTDIEIIQSTFEETKTKPRDLEEFLRGTIPEKFIPDLPHSFDIIGDIAIIEIPQELIEFSSKIGEGVMRIDPHIRLVLRKSGETSGTFRTRKFEAIAGIGSTETVHKEFSCEFHLDVATAYFNPRLSHERIRVAKQVKQGEHILDMFAGVGPYSILIAKTQETSKVYSIDINPKAFEYLKRNILVNRVAERVMPALGDATQFATGLLRRTANRVIMNLPSESIRFLEAAVQALKEDGGIIHFYAFASRNDDTDEIKKTVRSTIENSGRRVDSFPFSEIMKEVAPNRVQVAFDVLVK